MPDWVGHDGKRVGSDNKTDGMNRHIYRLVAAVLAAITIVSCNGARKSETFRVLEDVDSYIEARPDSALTVLEGIDVEDLGSREEKAKYALLMSMALDKNYIDRTDFEVLQPAIDYYESHGSATDKLRTFYYQGRIYQNGGESEEAIECFIKSINLGDESNDISTKARNYSAQGSLYSQYYNWEKYVQCNLEAAHYYKLLNNIDAYARMLLRASEGYIFLGENDTADELLLECNSYLNQISDSNKAWYYEVYLTHRFENITKEDAYHMIDEYLNLVPQSDVDWLTIANVYLSLEDIITARTAINKYIPNKSDNRYYALLTQIYKAENLYKEALSSYEQFNKITDSLDFVSLKQDTQFIEERHQLELKVLQEKEAKIRTALICIIALLVALIAIYLIRKQLKTRTAEKKQLEIEKKRYEQLYSDAIAERDALTKMIEDSSVKDETKAVIRERLEVLNKVIISHITDTSSANKKAFQELEALISDRDSFIESTRLTIEGNNPEFIAALKKQGLTDEEINICCLYVIGLKGKDIKAYTSQPRHYNQSADIRHKLGLTENDTNLSIFLREMLEK
jgi:tetratricopeptide (TPR) repeat protein